MLSFGKGYGSLQGSNKGIISSLFHSIFVKIEYTSWFLLIA